MSTRHIEVTVTVTFIVSIILIIFYGFKYFAGFQYASTFDRPIISTLGVIFILCLLYFVYRVQKWLVKIIMNILNK